MSLRDIVHIVFAREQMFHCLDLDLDWKSGLNLWNLSLNNVLFFFNVISPG